MRGSITKWFERPAVSLLIALRFTPSVATALGLVIASIATYFVYQGEFFIAGFLVLFGSVFDEYSIGRGILSLVGVFVDENVIFGDYLSKYSSDEDEK